MSAGKFQVGRVIVAKLAGSEVSRVVAAAGLRPSLIDGAASFAQKRANHILGGVFKWSQRKNLGGVILESHKQLRNFRCWKMSTNMTRDEKHFVGKNIDPQPAAKRASLAAGQLYPGNGHRLGIEPVNVFKCRAQRGIELATRPRTRDGCSELNGRILGHSRSPRCRRRMRPADILDRSHPMADDAWRSSVGKIDTRIAAASLARLHEKSHRHP